MYHCSKGAVTALACVALGLAAAAGPAAASATPAPGTVRAGAARFEILTPTLIRLEYAADGRRRAARLLRRAGRGRHGPAADERQSRRLGTVAGPAVGPDRAAPGAALARRLVLHRRHPQRRAHEWRHVVCGASRPRRRLPGRVPVRLRPRLLRRARGLPNALRGSTAAPAQGVRDLVQPLLPLHRAGLPHAARPVSRQPRPARRADGRHRLQVAQPVERLGMERLGSQRGPGPRVQHPPEHRAQRPSLRAGERDRPRARAVRARAARRGRAVGGPERARRRLLHVRLGEPAPARRIFLARAAVRAGRRRLLVARLVLRRSACRRADPERHAFR